MRRIVLVDLDGTISDDRWRGPLLKSSWDEYHQNAVWDRPYDHMVNLLCGLSQQDYHIIAVTGRPERWRGITMTWMFKHHIPACDLLMRPDNDYRKSHEVKMALVEPFINDVVMIIDDRDDIIEAFNALNVTTLLVRAR